MSVYDIVIIGGGAAGLTAAIYARRANLSVCVLESAGFGGQIMNTGVIENYPAAPNITGPDFAQTLYNQAESFKADFEYAEAEGIDETTENGKPLFTVHTDAGDFVGRTVIIASGTEYRKLGLENEDRLIGHGISYCATCDGSLYKGKPVAINGGGNVALNYALYMAGLTDTVYLIHRRDAFRGDDALVERIKNTPAIKLVLNSNITKINGGDKLESIEVTNNDGSVQNIDINCLFVCVGRIPNTAAYRGLIDIDDHGYIIANDKTCETSRPGIYAAGDVRVKDLRQLVTATSDGAVAVESALDFLNH